MKKQILKLKGKTAVFIDWANIYNWKKSLKEKIDLKKLFAYLHAHQEIKSINFYFGEDKHPKSKQFLQEIKKIGYQVITKPVKYIVVGRINRNIIKKRKCDFDIEICMKVYQLLNRNYQSFIFFSGDGDFAPLYQYLISEKKQVIVIYEKGFLGKEIWQINRGLFKTRLSYLIAKNNPRSKANIAGRDY